jgi:hypothetical protein
MQLDRVSPAAVWACSLMTLSSHFTIRQTKKDFV